MQKLGYQATFWHRRLDDYGAALLQGKVLCTVHYQKDLRGQQKMLWKP
jgi:hypothetical protein